MRISHFGAASFFGVFAIIELLLAVLGVVDVSPLFFCFCAAINLIFAVVYGKYLVFTESGIQHRFLGMCYRRTMWGEVKDVMLVYHQAERGRPKVLMFTTKDATIYRPGKNGYINSKEFNKDWFCGKLFSVRLDDKKTAGKILGYIEKYYGPLDYNFFEEK